MEDDGFDELGWCDTCGAKIAYGLLSETTDGKWVCAACLAASQGEILVLKEKAGMIRTPPQHNTTNPPGQIRNQCDGCAAGVPITEYGLHKSEEYGTMGCTAPRYNSAHPSAERYRQTTLKGKYLRDVIERIQNEERT